MDDGLAIAMDARAMDEVGDVSMVYVPATGARAWAETRDARGVIGTKDARA